MPKLNDRARTRRRQRILEAAEACFARLGFHSTTIADVRTEAGVSTGAVYTYFDNKEAMIRAILEGARDERRARLSAATQTGEGGAQALVLLEWVAEVFTQVGQHRARIDVHLWAEALRDAGVRKLAKGALRDALDAVRGVVAERLSDADRAGGIPVEADAVASVLVAIFLGLEVQRALGLRLDSAAIQRVLAALFADSMPPGSGSTTSAERETT